MCGNQLNVPRINVPGGLDVVFPTPTGSRLLQLIAKLKLPLADVAEVVVTGGAFQPVCKCHLDSGPAGSYRENVDATRTQLPFDGESFILALPAGLYELTIALANVGTRTVAVALRGDMNVDL